MSGMLIGVLSWHWAFFINVPLALIILAVTPFVVPAEHSRGGIRLDIPGAISVTLRLLAIVLRLHRKVLYGPGGRSGSSIPFFPD